MPKELTYTLTIGRIDDATPWAGKYQASIDHDEGVLWSCMDDCPKEALLKVARFVGEALTQQQNGELCTEPPEMDDIRRRSAALSGELPTLNQP